MFSFTEEGMGSPAGQARTTAPDVATRMRRAELFSHVRSGSSLTALAGHRDGRRTDHRLARSRTGGTAVDLLPVLPAFAGLLPDAGLRRGTTVSVRGCTALALALAAGPSRAGSWCAVVGAPNLGLAAAAEAGIVLDRLAVIPAPGRQWAEAVAALLEGMDLVIALPPARPGAAFVGPLAHQLTARARDRGTALISLGAWEGSELRLTGTASRWEGIDSGSGRLRSRLLTVEIAGRGSASRPVRGALWLPARDGAVYPAASPDVPTAMDVEEREDLVLEPAVAG